MQKMTWTLARLGSRFNLLFEPYKRRVMHSALGRFFDAPLDLQVGLVNPDGSLRVLPFTSQELTADGKRIRDLYNAEQFERFNSITFRGYCEESRLRFELNFHSVFWPQNDRLCTMPAFYMEMRISPVPRVRWTKPDGPWPEHAKLWLRLDRPDTDIRVALDGFTGDPNAGPLADAEAAPPTPLAQIALDYRSLLYPDRSYLQPEPPPPASTPSVAVHERIVSLNAGCEVTPDGQGLTLTMPVTEPGSGVKWRLIWATHIAEPVVSVPEGGVTRELPLRYTRFWDSVDAVVAEAIDTRDDRLARSRRLEKLIEQAPLDAAQSHLLNQSFQAFLSNTWWCTVPSAKEGERDGEWYALLEGSSAFLSTLDVGYNVSLWYLALWPDLLKLQINAWSKRVNPHAPSDGAYLDHDLGFGTRATGQAYDHAMELEENGNFLLMLQAYTRWTGDTSLAERLGGLVEDLARFLIWTDQDDSGFPTEGIANTIDDASPALRYGKKPVYLAVKRVAALRAVADLLQFSNRPEMAKRCETLVEADINKIEIEAWLGDHYGVCMERSAAGVIDPSTGLPADHFELTDWDAYCIYTGNALLLPTMIGQPPLLSESRLKRDLLAADRENLGRYGDGHTSDDPDNIRISQNLWRDMLARYMGLGGRSSAGLYWDMQVMSNTGTQSYGYIDTYIHNALAFYPRGIVAIGYFLSAPRLVIDRLAPGGKYITVEPNTGSPQRWPLLPLADWHAGRVPVCVVDLDGHVTIEGETDPVIIHGQDIEKNSEATGLIG